MSAFDVLNRNLFIQTGQYYFPDDFTRTNHYNTNNNYNMTPDEIKNSLVTGSPHYLARYLYGTLKDKNELGYFDDSFKSAEYINENVRGISDARVKLALSKKLLQPVVTNDVIIKDYPNNPFLPINDRDRNSQTYEKESFKIFNIINRKKEERVKQTNVLQSATYSYLNILQNRAQSLTDFLLTHRAYSYWKNNWKLLKTNLSKNNCIFKRLQESDSDIAYVINKGEEIKFRIYDLDKFVPLNVYQYVLCHEMAHMSTRELQHTPNFHLLLNLLVLASFELGMLDMKKIKLLNGEYLTNNQPILSFTTLRSELLNGIEQVIKHSEMDSEYYKQIRKYVYEL